MSAHDSHSGSESEEDDFNPQPEIDDDVDTKPNHASAGRGDEDDDDNNQGQTGAVDEEDDQEDAGGEDEEDEDDEDEEDEEEEDDDEDVVQRPHKRRRRARGNQFIDVEAEVDDEDEEEEGEDEEGVEEIHPDDEEPIAAELDDRRHRELDMQRQADATKDAEELAKELDEKYRRREMARAQKSGPGAIPLALPTIDDPSIWGLKCRPGKEKEIVLTVMRRLDQKMKSGQPQKVYSVFSATGSAMGGYLYCEADTKQDMLDILEGVSNIWLGTPPIPIPINERADLLRKQKREPLEVGKFVRVLRPPTYKGDLGKIVEVHANGLDASIQLVPRIDYGGNEDKDQKRKRWGTPAIRPPPKLFNEAEAKKKNMKSLTMHGTGANKQYTYKGESYINGFLVKEIKLNNLQTVNVNPRMDEMQLFNTIAPDGSETMDLVAVQAAQKAAQSGSLYVSGENVEIYDGEQKGVRGTTVSVRGDIVTLKVSEGDLKGRLLDAPVKTLRKLFRDGDHVKVIGGGKYIDEVGMVTRIKDDKVTLLCDSTQEEITVFSRDLKRAADSAQIGEDSHFQLYDMVYLDAATIACVIKVDRELLRVLDPQGSVRTVLQSQITHDAQPNRHAVATDKEGSEIRVADTIKEQGGEGRQGRVHYIHRGLIFAINREYNENGGMFVVRSQNVTTLASKSGQAQAAGPDLSKMNPSMVQQAANGAAMAPPSRGGPRDRMIGKTVTIRKGPYKGLLGIVKDTNANEARVELHTKNRVVPISKDFLSVKDPITGNTIDFGGKFPNRGRGGYTGSTPAHGGGRTPGWGNSGRTGQPSWGTPSGRTPAWGSGGKTPIFGGNTSYGPEGSRTAYGGGAYGGNEGSHGGGFNSGGRTPAPTWGSGQTSSKPAGSNTAPTPSAYTAPTPGAYQAPTPAAYGAYSAPTPGGPPMDAPTPGNFTAPTPGDTAAHPTPRGYGAYGSGYGATPAAAPTPGAWAEAPTPWSGAPETPAAVNEEPDYV